MGVIVPVKQQERLVNGVPWLVGSSLALVYSASAQWSPMVQHQLVILNFETPLFDRFSFPSGHSSRAAMLATLCVGFFPRYRFAATGLSALVAFSRVAMGRHYLSDALAGLGLGLIEGVMALALPRSFSRWLCNVLR
ncbi:unnamed protein product [Strongylus vulgaris]|uniref:Phosphatidic acid phosphatase type 2/haloperoxidase domain-containing protein n=1 Tax=Strongylus vulgaris TaxID=40348 RepID=A0A3P7JK40_STRVU|nr:unnamed protein product [Strongylus vulgaris]